MSEEDKMIRERYDLTIGRIASIPGEHTAPEPFDDFFEKTASFLFMLHQTDVKRERSLEEWQTLNRQLYADILPENYEESYANPAYAVERLGEVHGRILSFLYTELRGIIVYKFENRLENITILHELFIEIYNCFEEEVLPTYREIQQIIYWWVSDYSDLMVSRRIREAVDPSLDFAVKILMEEDLKLLI